MDTFRRIALAFVLLAPLTASAADIPVTYNVEEKRLKDALAGTPLTFTLYSDTACTTSVYSVVVPVENVALITKQKQFTPKNDVKLPKTVVLQHTLPGVTVPGNLYLKVTGTGVVPVAGACQAQAAQVAAPTCNDGVQNQSETDVDCGGPTICLRCSLNDSCVGNSDCSSANCTSGVCGPPAPTCSDGIQNQGETDIDCGGSNACPRCGDGDTCGVPGDCSSGLCSGGTCQPFPTCNDGIQNQDESDIDCGGVMCPACAPGDGCTRASDCTSQVCQAGTCQAPTCLDMVKNGTESDIDCGGGACPGCVATKRCNVGSDCLSNSCIMTFCQ